MAGESIWRDILVHTDGTPAGERRLDFAFDLADQHHAQLTGLHVTPPADVPPVFKPSMVDQAAEAIQLRLLNDAKMAEERFLALAAVRKVPTRWKPAAGTMAREICNAARCADLVIVGEYEWQGPAERHPFSLAEVVAMDCGRPVLVVPSAGGSLPLRHALIAWDGSREAVRALHDALPLLAGRGIEIEIGMVEENGRGSGLQALQDHLARHNIVAQGTVHSRESAPAKLLMDRLRTRHFDLLVMGAYSQPAWFEFLFGGTTQSILLNAPTLVLVSH